MSDAARPAVACRGLTKHYGPVRALDGLDLTVAAGESVALLGPSGCGKTTTLRLLAGFVAPDAGTITLHGRLVAGDGICVPPEARHVGIVFQDFALFPHLTVAGNVAYGLHRVRDAAARQAEVARALALVGLSGLGGRLPHELSGGQQQRVALARALAPRPALLLLDEPFSNLDARMRHLVRDEVRDILQAAAVATVFVTHDQEEALVMGDRVAILSGGRLEQIGTPEAVFHRPASRFVADFLGHTGFLDGTVVGGAVETEIGRLAQPCRLPDGTAVQVLARPDDLVVAADPAGPGRIERRYFQGMHHLYRIRLPSGATVKASTPHTVTLEPGTAVRVGFAGDHALVCFSDGQAVAEGVG